MEWFEKKLAMEQPESQFSCCSYGNLATVAVVVDPGLLFFQVLHGNL